MLIMGVMEDTYCLELFHQKRCCAATFRGPLQSTYQTQQVHKLSPLMNLVWIVLAENQQGRNIIGPQLQYRMVLTVKSPQHSCVDD